MLNLNGLGIPSLAPERTTPQLVLADVGRHDLQSLFARCGCFHPTIVSRIFGPGRRSLAERLRFVTCGCVHPLMLPRFYFRDRRHPAELLRYSEMDAVLTGAGLVTQLAARGTRPNAYGMEAPLQYQNRRGASHKKSSAKPNIRRREECLLFTGDRLKQFTRISSNPFP